MIALANRSSVLLVDPLNADRGHLVDDDLFLAQCLLPIVERLLVVTSPESEQNIRGQIATPTRPISPFDERSRFPRWRLLRIAATLPSSPFRDVIFQSFEELSALTYMLLHPRSRVHLIVTSNLRPDRFQRSPVVGLALFRAAVRRATSVIVHSEFEVSRIATLVPDLDLGKVFIKPFHQMGLQRNRRGWEQKDRTILFLGPVCAHKPLEPLLQLIAADTAKKFRYVLAGASNLTPQARDFLARQEHVEIVAGYLESERYFELFSRAALVMLTHDRKYEGALSGAFCDAVACGTPVIARDMAPHNEFFRRAGALGFLVDYSDSQWCRQILDADLVGTYGLYQQNLRLLRGMCTMEANQEVFRAILTREN